MITPKKISMILGVLMIGMYIAISRAIENMDVLKIPFTEYSIHHILELVEKFEFKGTWSIPSGNLSFNIPNFKEANGTVHMKLFINKMDLFPHSYQNMTVDNDFSYVFHLRLNDGQMPSKNKHFYKLRIPLGEDFDSKFKFTRKMTFINNEDLNDCTFQNELFIDQSKFKMTHSLEDLEFLFHLSSQDQVCQSNIKISVKYDDFSSHKQVLRFLVSALLVTLYEMAVIINFSQNLYGFEYNFKFQSIVFWSTIGMFSCLNCFVCIYNSTNFTNYLPHFLIIGIFNFVNFAIIVLKILNRYVRILHEITRFDTVV